MLTIDVDRKGIVYKHLLKDRSISIVNCEEDIINDIQEVTGDIFQLRYLGIDAEYDFYLALEKENVLGYSIVQKYFEKHYIRTEKGKRRGEPALVYSLERKKGIGSLLFLVSSLEILKDDKVEVFRCEAVQNNVLDNWCSKLSLYFVGKKEIFNCYESVLKDNRKDLEQRIIKYVKSL